jgi:hypothetical protein
MIREPHCALDTADSHVKFIEIPVLIVSCYFVIHMEHQIHVVKSRSANTEINHCLSVPIFNRIFLQLDLVS